MDANRLRRPETHVLNATGEDPAFGARLTAELHHERLPERQRRDRVSAEWCFPALRDGSFEHHVAGSIAAIRPASHESAL
jgi:hypothetical protein